MSEKIMNRSDVIVAIATKTELPESSVDAIIKEYEGLIVNQLTEGGEIRLTGFGTFKTFERAERNSRNPRTGELITIAARSVARFVPGKAIKEIGANKG